ncbi:hypothetical protein AAE478_006983 [Parahypoxylon ruwenzoriense]
MATTTQQVGLATQDTQAISLTGDVRKQLLIHMKGAQVIIPDLQSLTSHWPQRVHPEIERLDEYVQQTLESIFPNDEIRLRKTKASDIAVFGASWWAYAPFEELCIATCLSIWLFVWDDETDSPEFSTIINDWDKASIFRDKTILYLQESLSGSSGSKLSDITTNPIVTSFGPVGEAVSKSCDDRQISTFLDELVFYIKMCEEEQKLEISPRLPTIDEYMRRRMGSGGVRVCLAIQEYTCGITLSREIQDDEAMQCLWDETNIIIVYGFQAQSQTDSLIPLLSVQLGVQGAIDRATDIVRLSVQRFEEAEKRILERYSSIPKVQEDILKFVDGCKYACTANLNWR